MAREVYTVRDIVDMLGVSMSKAYKVMREVKAVSNILNIKGIIHKNDWDAYLKRKGGAAC